VKVANTEGVADMSDDEDKDYSYGHLNSFLRKSRLALQVVMK
jgi:hypothetical protein